MAPLTSLTIHFVLRVWGQDLENSIYTNPPALGMVLGTVLGPSTGVRAPWVRLTGAVTPGNGENEIITCVPFEVVVIGFPGYL